MVQFQDSILECLRYHTFFNILFNKILEAHHAQTLSCSNLGVGAWFIVQPNFPNFWLFSPFFSMTLRTQLELPHPSIASLPWCVCTHLIDPMGIHLLHCAHGNERMGTHDAVCNTFVAIAQDVGFHVGWTQLHALPSTTHNSSHWRIDIVLTKDEIRTLTNFVMVDPTHADLLVWCCTTQGFVAFDVIQTKEKNYCD
jgi:hypothetical protein